MSEFDPFIHCLECRFFDGKYCHKHNFKAPATGRCMWAKPKEEEKDER